MFEEVLGLPAHPLIVHTAVIFIPLLAVGSVVYGVVPRWRPALGWAVAALGVAAPLTAFAARQSGEAFQERLFSGGAPEGAMAQRIQEHESFALPLLLTSIGLGAVALLLVYSAARLGKTATTVLSVLTVPLALAAGFYVLRAGHTGATAVWGG
ncbi:hypothetical protein Ssi03_60730 [Sphaerisporangium siamense]|uniref:DUF2231 domain-containing protein n=1 Tax=Sphaerisporangium siamense TaxID=795645 RepID=A0A7W7DAJ0_9ACTN|nr:DUF2231 domain-containing protein [Sphaerisporangium siamense]MBB4703304.1 hypothetical protein [Sphaerisporangium siamense]GII88083.1 hypothetical protein Ssi03_60730 [Sphaerisporangium siamense]